MEQAQFLREMEIGVLWFSGVLALYYFCNFAHAYSHTVSLGSSHPRQTLRTITIVRIGSDFST
jgi:hypothetical protein